MVPRSKIFFEEIKGSDLWIYEHTDTIHKLIGYLCTQVKVLDKKRYTSYDGLYVSQRYAWNTVWRE